MTVEEVLIKLGVDSSKVDEGLRQAQVKVHEAMGHTHNSFLHGTAGAKGFKKVLHEIMAEAGPLGYAINAAISPIGGTFLAAAAAVTYFNKKLDESYEKAIKATEINSRAITNVGARESARRAAGNFLSDDAEQFARRRNDTGGPDNVLSSAKAELVKAGFMDDKDPVSRALLQRVRSNLRLQQRRQGELIDANRESLGEDNAARLQGLKDLAAAYEDKIKQIEPNEGKLRIEAGGSGEPTKTDIARGWLGFFTGKSSFNEAVGSKNELEERRKAAQTELDNMEIYKRKLEEIRERIQEHERINAKNKEELKEAESAIIGIEKAIKKVDAAIKSSAPPAQTFMDPRTGGVAYRPLPGAPGYHDPITGEAFTPGFKYRPLPGARGYVDPTAVNPRHSADVNADALMRLVYDRILGDGIPVVGKD